MTPSHRTGRRLAAARAWIALATALSLAAARPTHAQDAGTESVFATGIGNRPLAMGGAYAALADDAAGLLWNPGGLARAPRFAFEAGQATGAVSGASETWGMAVLPSWRWGAVGASVRHLGVSGIETRDDRDFLVGSSTSDQETELTFGYGRPINETFGFGVSAKARRQSLAGLSASGFGVDAGVSGGHVFGNGETTWGGLRFGLAIANLVRPSLKLDRESVADPARVRGGVAWTPQIQGLRSCVVAADLVKPTGLPTSLHLGVAAGVLPGLELRTGIDGGALTAGAGISWHRVTLDYAYESTALSAVHRVGLSCAIGPSVDESRALAQQRDDDRLQQRLDAGFQQRQAEQVAALLSRATERRRAGAYDEALDLLAAAATLDPAHPGMAELTTDCNRAQAAALERHGDEAGAAIAYNRVLATAPSDSVALVGLARCRAVSDSLAARTATTRHWFAVALTAFGADDFAAARDTLQQLLAAEPADPGARTLLDRTQEAIAARVRALLRGAAQNVDAGRLDAAAAQLDETQRLNPDASGLAEARAAWSRAHAEALASRAVAPADSAAAPRAPRAPAASKLPRRELELLYRQGLAALQQGRSDEALHCWEIVWTSSPDYGHVAADLEHEYLTRGMEAFAAGRLEDAAGFWRRAQRVAPGDPRPAGYLARAEKQLSRTREILGSND